MTVTFYSQPYSTDAEGFYFTDAQSYRENINTITDSYGNCVEEFEIQFINGFVLDSKLAKAITPDQNNILAMMKAMATWTEDQKIKVYLAIHEAGMDFDVTTDDPDDIDMDLYAELSLRDLAYQFVDEGLFGDVSDKVLMYLDYDAIARDLAHDYSEVTVCGEPYVYRLA